MTSIDRIAAQEVARSYAQTTDTARSAAAADSAQQASNRASLNPTTPAPTSDSVTLSDSARSVAFARQAVKNAPDVREQKVADIKKQVSDGTYHVSSSVLARKLLATSSIKA